MSGRGGGEEHQMICHVEKKKKTGQWALSGVELACETLHIAPSAKPGQLRPGIEEGAVCSQQKTRGYDQGRSAPN